MARLPADRSLRRLVSRLAEEDSADVQAVLDRLEPAYRLRVHALLKTYLETARDGVENVSAISPWLEARVSETSDIGIAHPWTMTPTARASLARARETLGPSVPKAPPPEPGSRTWFDRQFRKGRPA